MTDTDDVRRRRIRFRAWHRGMRELDIIMGSFVDRELPSFDERDLDAMEQLMEVPDRDVLEWVTGAAPLPPNYDTSVFQRLRSFHTHTAPIYS